MTYEHRPVVQTVDHGTAKLVPDLDRARGWLLTVDGAPQSYVDLDEPEHLEFEYTRRIGHVLRSAFGGPLDAVHLGGGALTLPRWLHRARPGSRQQVVEVDRALVCLVAEHLPLAGEGVTVHVQDARQWIAGAPTGSADAVVVDVFSGARVPAHLTSVEFVDDVRRVLRPAGLYVANLADAAPFDFLRRQLGTVRAAFGPGAEMCLLAEPAVLRGRRFGNTVLVAAHRRLPLAAIGRSCAGDPFPARVVTGPDLDGLTGEPVDDRSAASSPQPPDGAFTVG